MNAYNLKKKFSAIQKEDKHTRGLKLKTQTDICSIFRQSEFNFAVIADQFSFRLSNEFRVQNVSIQFHKNAKKKIIIIMCFTMCQKKKRKKNKELNVCR